MVQTKVKCQIYRNPSWFLTWEQSTELSEGQAPNDGPEDEGPDDDDAVGGQHCAALKNDERPIAQRVEGEAAGAAEVDDRRGARWNNADRTWNWNSISNLCYLDMHFFYILMFITF